MQYDCYVIKFPDGKFVFKRNTFVKLKENARKFNTTESAQKYAKSNGYTEYEIITVLGKEKYLPDY